MALHPNARGDRAKDWRSDFRLQVLVALALLVLPLANPPVARAFPSNVVVVSSYHWVDSNGYVHVSGELENQGGEWEKVVVDAGLYDAGGDKFASTYGYPFYPTLPPGARTGFDLQTTTKRTDIDHIDLLIDRVYPETKSGYPLSVRLTGTAVGSSGELTIEGTLTNSTPYRVANPGVLATLRSGDGAMVGWASGGLKDQENGTPRYYLHGHDTEPFSVTVAAGQWQQGQPFTLQASGRISDVVSGNLISWDLYLEDVARTAFRDDILWIAHAGISDGCAVHRFCPTDEVTRAQMASFIVRALGLSEGGNVDYFTDDEGSPHEADINRLRHAGITLGCAPGRYCPARTVTREQMASFLVRALALGPTSVDYFRDDEGSRHEADINALAASGVSNGCGPSRFCPLGTVTREQMAAFLRRGLQN